MMETRFGIGLTAFALVLTSFILMLGFLYDRSRAEPEYRGSRSNWLRTFLVPVPADYSDKGRPAAMKALWCMIALTFVMPAAGTAIEKGAHLFGKPVYLPSGQAMPPIALEICFAMFFIAGLVVGLGSLLQAGGRYLFARNGTVSFVRHDLWWSGAGFLFAFAHMGWMTLLRRIFW